MCPNCVVTAVPPARRWASVSLLRPHMWCLPSGIARFASACKPNMSAFKRKRGGQAPLSKKAKKAKFVADGGESPDEIKQEKTDEITVPAPVSMVSS